MTIIWIEHVLHTLNSVVERELLLDFGRVIGLRALAAIMASREVRGIYLGIEV
jgi:branched-chain amino acid transport system ATP-binding protein